MKKLKKWNWAAFLVVYSACMVGALSNGKIPSIAEAFIFGSALGIPTGILFAYVTREPNK